MYKFLVSCLQVLAEIPGLSSAEDSECLRTLDAEKIEERYQSLSEEQREAMGELYRQAQALLVKQSNLQKAAHQLGRSIAERLLRTAPYDMPADNVIQGCIVHRDLSEIIGEVAPEDNRVLLMLAQWMLSHSDTPPDVPPVSERN